MAALRRADFEAVTDDAFSFLLTDHAYAAYPAEAGGYLGSGILADGANGIAPARRR